MSPRATLNTAGTGIVVLLFLLAALIRSWVTKPRPYADEEQEAQTRPWSDCLGEPDDN